MNIKVKNSDIFAFTEENYIKTVTRLIDNPDYYFQPDNLTKDEGGRNLLLAELTAPHTKSIRIYVGIECVSELQKEILPESNDKEYYLDIDLPDKVDYVTYWASDYGDSLKEALKQLCIDHGLTTFYEELFGENEQII